MATNSLQSLHHHHHHHSLIRRHSVDTTTTTTPPPSIHFSSQLSLKPNTTTPSLSYTHHSLSTTTAFSLSATSASASATSSTTTTTPSTSLSTSLDLLEQHLISQNFRQADDETRRLLIALAGEAAIKRGYVFFSEAKFISETALIAIDDLWKKHSNNKFGYSVQKKIWEQKANKDFTKFFIKVGWMKKLDTEVEQYNYRAFPNEFIWELNDDTPMGHLPLTNALRGTQLLNSVLTHPAFDQDMQESDGEEEEDKAEEKLGLRDGPSKPPLSNGVFKTDYSF